MPTSLDTYAPFDTGAGANVTEDTWRKFMRHMLGSASGVIRGFTNEFLVSGDGSGMNVKVATGECWIRGHYGESTAQKTLAIAAAHATLGRLDRVILRADFANNRVEVDVLTGTPAASPILPAVTQSTTVWETSLAVVSVAAAASSIVAGAVTDDRVFTTANAKYHRRAAAPTFPLATNTFTKLSFTDIEFRSGDVAHNVAATDFTLKRAGLWVVSARAQMAANAAGGRSIHISDPFDMSTSSPGSLVYGAATTNGLSGMNNILTCSATERFPAGKVISLIAWQNSGGSIAVHPIEITFTWIGP